MNSIFLGDTITMLREIGDDCTYITGKVTGIVTEDRTGEIRYITIKGIEQAIWLNQNWKFVDNATEEVEYEDEDE